eukprot:gene34058-41223_t
MSDSMSPKERATATTNIGCLKSHVGFSCLLVSGLACTSVKTKLYDDRHSKVAYVKSTSGVARKVRKSMAQRPVVADQRARNASLENSAKATNLPWRIVGSTILHRYPVIAKEMTEPWELKMHELQDKIEGDRKKWLMEKIKGTSAQIIPDSELSYEEIVDSMPFKPASRKTEADEKNDRKSLDRRLDDSLFLIVKRNRSDHSWQFPQG